MTRFANSSLVVQVSGRRPHDRPPYRRLSATSLCQDQKQLCIRRTGAIGSPLGRMESNVNTIHTSCLVRCKHRGGSTKARLDWLATARIGNTGRATHPLNCTIRSSRSRSELHELGPPRRVAKPRRNGRRRIHRMITRLEHGRGIQNDTNPRRVNYFETDLRVAMTGASQDRREHYRTLGHRRLARAAAGDGRT